MSCIYKILSLISLSLCGPTLRAGFLNLCRTELWDWAILCLVESPSNVYSTSFLSFPPLCISEGFPEKQKPKDLGKEGERGLL